MKKLIFMIALMAISLLSIAQTTPVTKPDTTKKYSADPKRVYQLEVTADQLSSLLETSSAGVIPYLKQVKLTMDRLDQAQAYYGALHQYLIGQYRKQYVADSLQTVKPVKRK